MKNIKKIILLLTSIVMLSCTSLSIPKDSEVIYYERQSTITLNQDLANLIIMKLNSPADNNLRNAAMPKSFGKRLEVDGKVIGVENDSMTLMDSWGIRTWYIENLEMKIKKLITKESTEFVPNR